MNLADSTNPMIPGSLAVDFGGHAMHLLPQRAIWWPTRRTLLLADVHFGKSAAFRVRGVPVPGGSTARDLSRIADLLASTAATRLIILGDLVHGPVGKLAELIQAITAWRRAHQHLEILLVRGNHDRAAGRVPSEWNMREVAEPHLEDVFQFSHTPPDRCDKPTFAGHIHPTAHLRDFDGSVVCTPCFVLERNCLTVPAFGTFTGGYPIYPQDDRFIYVVSPTRVVRL